MAGAMDTHANGLDNTLDVVAGQVRISAVVLQTILGEQSTGFLLLNRTPMRNEDRILLGGSDSGSWCRSWSCGSSSISGGSR